MNRITQLFSFFLALTLLSCAEEQPEKGPTYLGGEIVNPNEDYITISRNDTLLDTVYLNNRNRFSYTFKNKADGLYTLRHSPESQIFYIENGDSLLLRLNTLAFDESLMYSGKRARENNFLMEMFLLNEKNNDLIYSYYKTKPEEFAQKTDSIRKRRKNRLKKLQKNHHFSKEFRKIATKSIAYEYYDLRERYSFLINKYFNINRSKISESFFDYRKHVNFNDEQFQSYYVYRRYLDNYLRNRSIEYCIENDLGRDCFNLNGVENLNKRIQLADSIFTLPTLKKSFITRFLQKEIVYAEDKDELENALSKLQEAQIPEKSKEYMEALANIQSSFFIGTNISNKKILSPELKKIKFKDALRKKTIIFSWSLFSTKQHTKRHERINELRNRYPEIDFIGVNINDGDVQLWLKALQNFDYDRNYEFQLRNTGDAKSLYRNYLDKILFLDKTGKIVYGKIKLNDPNFENYVLEFLNR